jgi:hypothetical protein
MSIITKRSKKMNNEFIQYIENKIANGSPEEIEFDRTLLSLYKKGLISVKMREGELLIGISQTGTNAYMNEVALSFADPVEA